MNQNQHIFRNEVPWEETVNDILTYTQQGAATGQTLLNQYTGNTPITEGNLPNGSGNYQITTHDTKDDNKKTLGIPTPYFWGGVALIAVVGVFVFAITRKKALIKGQ